MAASGDACGDAQRYEQLRQRALGGEAAGWRLGLAVLEHRGVAAWMRAWRTTTPPASPPAERGAPAGGDEVVAVLAQMAVACLGRG